MFFVFLTFVGIFIFIIGGFSFDSYFPGQKVLIELDKFGLFFVPIIIFIFFNKKEIKNRSLKSFIGFIDKIVQFIETSERKKQNQFLFWTISIIALSHFMGTLSRYRSYNADWDMAIYANACSNFLYSFINSSCFSGSNFDGTPLGFL